MSRPRCTRCGLRRGGPLPTKGQVCARCIYPSLPWTTREPFHRTKLAMAISSLAMIGLALVLVVLAIWLEDWRYVGLAVIAAVSGCVISWLLGRFREAIRQVEDELAAAREAEAE